LALVGDAVLGLVVADLLLAKAPDDGVGPLTERRAALVSAPTLAAWAVGLGIPACLRLGRGEHKGGGALKESILATALEAVVGAMYQEAGLAPVRALVHRLVEDPAFEGRPRPC
jgi:ribonuclease-3